MNEEPNNEPAEELPADPPHQYDEEEAKALRLLRLEKLLAETDWLALREHDRRASNPDYVLDAQVFAYRDYLRQFNHQPEWFHKKILNFASWKASQ
jgi:hypothetical protein